MIVIDEDSDCDDDMIWIVEVDDEGEKGRSWCWSCDYAREVGDEVDKHG